ncbi:MAG: exo-alpha-sialidase [Pirellulales bacterium]|nr:exo-alpha-sialidase [Pirellulales bacterium]
MRMEILDAGFVAQVSASERSDSIAIGSRVVVLPNGELLCSFMRSAKTATNDFTPVLHRSCDLGRTWTDEGPVWPHLRDRWSLFVSISRDAAGRLFLYGARSAIDVPGESNWSDATQGLKANELIWSRATDLGRTWEEPAVIPMPIAGSAETPGPLLVTRSGRWLAPYSPYNTFDPQLTVDRSQVVVLWSDDEGRTWRHTSMLRFADPQTSAAEAWIVELSDGRLLATCWHIADRGGELPNAFGISRDGGETWSPTRSTSILGQTTALAPWTEGRALFLYNQRKHGEPGVWLAVVRPTDDDFGIEHNAIVWKAQTRTRSASSGDLSDWSDFSFGEPSAALLPDGTWLVTLWCIQPSGTGIRYLRLRIE